MTTCDGCIYAEWRLTPAGRKHPSREGRCKKLEVHPLDLRIPAAFYWLSNPRPTGGHIKRGEQHREKCVFKQRDAE